MVETTIDRDEQPSKPDTGLGNEPPRRDSEPPRIGGFETLTPGDFNSPSSGEPRRRGRKPGSKNRPRDGYPQEAQSNLITNLESLLLSVHFMAAKILEVEELELSEDEAKKLSDGLKKVADFYPVSISPKRLAIAELTFAAAGVYGPRIVTIYKKTKPKQQRVAPQQQSPQQQPQQPPQQPPQAGPRAVPQSQPRAANGPRVPSEMWNQDANEIPTDQA